MAIVCPRCATPAQSTEIVHSAGRMLRCTRCGTTWFVRVKAADPFTKGSGESPHLAVGRSGRPRFEWIVEHDGRGSSGQGRPQSVGRSESDRHGKPRASGGLGIGRRLFGGWLGAVAMLAVSGLIAILAFQSAVVGAAPAAGTAQFAGLEIRLVRATIERVHNQKAVIVIGEIANRSGRNLSVPAVRIALLSGGNERHAWLHQPRELQLGAGASLTFRSMLTSPPAGVDAVAFRLAQRPTTVVGKR
jgi:hypothetical protein